MSEGGSSSSGSKDPNGKKKKGDGSKSGSKEARLVKFSVSKKPVKVPPTINFGIDILHSLIRGELELTLTSEGPQMMVPKEDPVGLGVVMHKSGRQSSIALNFRGVSLACGMYEPRTFFELFDKVPQPVITMLSTGTKTEWNPTEKSGTKTYKPSSSAITALGMAVALHLEDTELRSLYTTIFQALAGSLTDLLETPSAESLVKIHEMITKLTNMEVSPGQTIEDLIKAMEENLKTHFANIPEGKRIWDKVKKNHTLVHDILRYIELNMPPEKLFTKLAITKHEAVEAMKMNHEHKTTLDEYFARYFSVGGGVVDVSTPQFPPGSKRLIVIAANFAFQYKDETSGSDRFLKRLLEAMGKIKEGDVIQHRALADEINEFKHDLVVTVRQGMIETKGIDDIVTDVKKLKSRDEVLTDLHDKGLWIDATQHFNDKDIVETMVRKLDETFKEKMHEYLKTGEIRKLTLERYEVDAKPATRVVREILKFATPEMVIRYLLETLFQSNHWNFEIFIRKLAGDSVPVEKHGEVELNVNIEKFHKESRADAAQLLLDAFKRMFGDFFKNISFSLYLQSWPIDDQHAYLWEKCVEQITDVFDSIGCLCQQKTVLAEAFLNLLFFAFRNNSKRFKKDTGDYKTLDEVLREIKSPLFITDDELSKFEKDPDISVETRVTEEIDPDSWCKAGFFIRSEPSLDTVGVQILDSSVSQASDSGQNRLHDLLNAASKIKDVDAETLIRTNAQGPVAMASVDGDSAPEEEIFGEVYSRLLGMLQKALRDEQNENEIGILESVKGCLTNFIGDADFNPKLTFKEAKTGKSANMVPDNIVFEEFKKLFHPLAWTEEQDELMTAMSVGKKTVAIKSKIMRDFFKSLYQSYASLQETGDESNTQIGQKRKRKDGLTTGGRVGKKKNTPADADDNEDADADADDNEDADADTGDHAEVDDAPKTQGDRKRKRSKGEGKRGRKRQNTGADANVDAGTTAGNDTDADADGDAGHAAGNTVGPTAGNDTDADADGDVATTTANDTGHAAGNTVGPTAGNSIVDDSHDGSA